MNGNIVSPEGLTQELIEARKMQMGMLPQSAPEISGFQIAAHSSPAVAVGGDFYDFIQLGDDKLGVMIGDAVGHGIAAALLMAMTLTEFRSMAQRYASPAEVLNGVNRRLTQIMPTRTSVSSIYAVLDRSSNRLTCAMAGMQPWLIKAKSGQCVPIEPSGVRFPLGMSQKLQYQSCDVQMEAGDALVLFTDGIPEAENENDEMYSFERLEKILLMNGEADAQELMDVVLSDVRQFTGDNPQEDDITMVVLKATESRVAAPDELSKEYIIAEEQSTGENRLITALFANIHGFTTLSDTQSPEVIFQLMQDYFRELVGIVASYEGSISGFRGDGLLALFGAPVLHENDAERAILAAMDMLVSMREQGLGVSIGINTAMVTVGEIQTQLHSEYTAYGTGINLAQLLQAAAEPGQILIGIDTHRLTRRTFDFQALPALEVKGFTQKVTAYVVQQVKMHPEKLRGIEGLRARMIGREHEFAELKDAANNLISDRGSIVTITGEAGIGKSRLALELKEYLEDKDVIWYEGRSISIGQTVSYCPFLDILRTYLNLRDDDTESEVVHKLMESMTDLFPDRWEGILPFIGYLLSVRFGDELDEKLVYFTPEQIRHKTLMCLKDVFTEISRRKPLLLILEDMHWSDDLSLDLVSLLMDELPENPLMLLCIYRPEREHGAWQIRNVASRKCLDRYTEITLKKLSAMQCRQLVESLLEIENLPQTTKDMILKKSEGNPFFIEEVIRFLIARDLVYPEGDRWKARSEISDINVPDTIQSVVLARVDRLQAEAKYVLQCASVIGRLFRYLLLEHLTRREQNLDQHLREFEERELVYEERTVPELEYAFRHAFTQEATYQGILERRRREFHHQVAQGIEQLYQERLGEYYEELAYHYSRSDDTLKAIEYLQKSGEKAARLSAYEEAVAHLSEGLELLRSLPDTLERTQQELMLQVALGPTLAATMGYGAPEVERTFDQARELCGQIGEIPQLVPVLQGLSAFYIVRSELQTARKLSEQSLNLIESMQAPELLLMNHYTGMISLLSLSGEFAPALEHLEHSIALYNPQQHKYLVGLFGADVRVNGWGALDLLWLGYPDQARERNKKDLKLARKLSHPFTVANSLGFASMYHHECREWQEAQECAEKTVAHSTEYGFPYWLASGTVCSGVALAEQGRLEEGIAQIEEGLAAYRAVGQRAMVTKCLTHLGKAYGEIGQIEKGLNILAEALEMTCSTGECFYESEIHRVKGELLLMQGEGEGEAEDEVEACFQKAINVAKQQQAKLFELRAAMSLSRLWQKQGKQEETRQVLAEIYDWFTEGFDTKDLKEAKTMLEELS